MNQGHSFSYSDSLIFIKIQQYRRSMVQPGTSGNRCCKFVVWSDQHLEYTGNHGTQHYCCWSKKKSSLNVQVAISSPHWLECNSSPAKVLERGRFHDLPSEVQLSMLENVLVWIWKCWGLSLFRQTENTLENKESWKGSKVTPSNVWEGIDRGWCSSSWRARSY